MDYKIIPIIDESNWPVEIKTELTQLTERFLALLAEEKNALDEMHKSRAGCNEKQYSKRLKEPLSTDKRNEVLSIQFAYRLWFANALMRVHEARRALSAQAVRIRARLEDLVLCNNEGSALALVAISRMVREHNCDDVDSILSEFDKVSELTRDRIFGAVLAIFRSKRDRNGIFCKTNFTSSPLMLVDRTPTEMAMDDATEPAIAIRARFEELWSEFISARSKFNVRQFNERMEACIQASDDVRLAQVRSDMMNAEARLFIAASRYAEAFGDLKVVVERLETAIQANADTIPNTVSTESVKAMCHCMGAWHWLNELTGYIEDKYRGCNPDSVLRELDFDPKAYLKA